MSAAQSLAPLLMAKAQEEVEVAVKANYMQSLTDACNSLEALKLQNPYLEIDTLETILIEEREKIRKHPGRLIPVTEEKSEDSNDNDQIDPQCVNTKQSHTKKGKSA